MGGESAGMASPRNPGSRHEEALIRAFISK